MSGYDSLNKNLNDKDLAEIVERIKKDTAVGIDAQLTHAIIIDYLRNISQRLERLEKQVKA